MSNVDLQTLVAAANARYTDPERNRIVNEKAGGSPRFELYHFFMSMCSYKVRATLDEKDVSYISHDINILPPIIQNYFPEYVRLRLRGKENADQALASGYTGRSSTETEGLDPCVVPTLVDHEAGKVLVDSKRICMYLDEVVPNNKLIPEDLQTEIVRQLDIVDGTPHPGLFYGGDPTGDKRPDFLSDMMKTAHDVKIAKLRENMATVSDDAELVAAYEHKISKEQGGKAFVRTQSDMRGIMAEFRDMLGNLEKDLETTGGEWLFGNRFTMADLFWGVSLFRMKWVGIGYLWSTKDGDVLPRVEAYSRRLFARPSIDRTTIHWPMLPPSEHVMEYYEN